MLRLSAWDNVFEENHVFFTIQRSEVSSKSLGEGAASISSLTTRLIVEFALKMLIDALLRIVITGLDNEVQQPASYFTLCVTPYSLVV